VVDAAPDRGPHCWLHPEVEVQRSEIAGRGVFATGDLPGGTVVWRLGGPASEHEVLAAEDLRFVNHACDPVLGWVDGHSLATMTDVAAGTELVTDYAMSIVEPAWVLRCHCPSYRCRQMVEGTDWQITQLQQRYDGWWAPHVQRLVDRARTISDRR
jgi:uncharacterized protein